MRDQSPAPPLANMLINVVTSNYLKKGSQRNGFSKLCHHTMVAVAELVRRLWRRVAGPIKRALRNKTLLCADGAKAWAKVAAHSKKPLLKGVQHGKRLFTPCSSLKRSEVDKKRAAFLDRSSRPKTKATAAYKRKRAAGDNAAEGLIGAVKGTARRVGAVQGGRQKRGGHQKAVLVQSSASLLRECGFYAVPDAARAFRLACSNGAISLSPRDSFVPGKHAWQLGGTIVH